jgi:hypothetical protein
LGSSLFDAREVVHPTKASLNFVIRQEISFYLQLPLSRRLLCIFEVDLARHRLIFIDAHGVVDEDNGSRAMGKRYETRTAATGGPIVFIASFGIKGGRSFAFSGRVLLI